MCFDDDARPPYPPVRGGASEHADLLLQSADGTKFMAYYAHPDAASTRGIVILPDVRGLHRFYKELAQRFADAGLHAIAIDYFGRTAGTGAREDDFPYREHLDHLTFDQVREDTGAAVDWLGSVANGTVRSRFTVGFCYGGAMSWRQSASGYGLAGCIGFYGVPSRAEDVVDQMEVPLLLLAAGQDRTPVDAVEHFAEQVRARGVEAELHVYPNATHSFFDKRFDEFRGECEDAWRRILDFVDRHSS
jgi:carboxymethylenebutenolidase